MRGDEIVQETLDMFATIKQFVSEKKHLAEYEALQARLTLPFCLGLAAEAAVVGGAPAEARLYLRRAMAIVRGTGECWYHAELHRLRARLLLSEGRPDLARLALQRALQIARARGAAGFESRAALQIREF